MGWEDTIFDNTARLEKIEAPSEVVLFIKGYLETRKDDYYPEWQNKYLGCILFNNVMTSEHEVYTKPVSELWSQVSEVADTLLAAYRQGQDWDANEAQKRVATFMCDPDIQRLEALSEGEVFNPHNRSEYHPKALRKWSVTDYDVRFETEPKGYLNEDVFLCEITLEHSETGNTRKHTITKTIDKDAFKRNKDSGFGDLKFFDLDTLKEYRTGSVQYRDVVGEGSDYSRITINAKADLNLAFEDESVPFMLHFHCSVFNDTAEIASIGTGFYLNE